MIASLVSFVSRLTKREKVAFYGALLVVSLMLLDRLMLRPILVAIDKLDKDIAEIEESVRKSLGVIDREEELLERAGMYASYLKKPGSDDIEKLSLMDHIQDLASKSSVVAKDIRAILKPADDVADTSLKRYIVDLTCEGEIDELVSFFYDIEESKEKLLRIENFHMVLKKKDSKIITCTMEISRYVIL